MNPPYPCWNIDWLDFVQAITIAKVLQMQGSSHVKDILCWSGPPPPLAITTFLPPFSG